MSLIVSSQHSKEISLKAVREGKYGLSKKRKEMLQRTPNIGDWTNYPLYYLETDDIAFLTAKTCHEYAILRGKKEDVLFHGDSLFCRFEGVLADFLESGKLRLYAHSHPNEDNPIPSNDDRRTLKIIHQKNSIIVSATTGRVVEYSQNQFELGGVLYVDN